MNYKNLSTAQLEALLETADSDTLQTIKSILKERQNPTKSPETEPEAEPELLPLSKMSAVRLKSTAKSLASKYEGQPCQVIPYDSDEWIDGMVLGVLVDIIHHDIKFSVKTREGKRLTKSYLDPTIKIQERVNGCKYEEPKPKKRRETARDRANNNWDPEEAIEKATHAVGCLVLYQVNVNEETGQETNIFARIISIHAHVQNCCIMMRLKVPAESGKFIIRDRVFHDGVTLLTDDEKTEAVRGSFIDRRERRKRRDSLNPTQRLRLCESNFDKAQEALNRAKDMLEYRRRQLQDAQDELRNSALTKQK